MPKKPKVDFEDFINLQRESYEKGHSDSRLVKKLVEMGKHLGIKLSIKPVKH
jgi:hypothetical protein